MSNNKPDVSAGAGSVTKHSHAFLIIFPSPRKTIKSRTINWNSRMDSGSNFSQKQFPPRFLSEVVSSFVTEFTKVLWSFEISSDGFPQNVLLFVFWASLVGIEAPSDQDNHHVEAAEAEDASPEAQHTSGYGLGWWHKDEEMSRKYKFSQDTWMSGRNVLTILTINSFVL